MARLPLAVDIADAVADARRRQSSFDVKAKAKQLLEEHPEAGAAQSDIEETFPFTFLEVIIIFRDDGRETLIEHDVVLWTHIARLRIEDKGHCRMVLFREA